MIDKISFKNYKLFKKEQTLELKPITILIGKNSSGKSAVAKLPTLIEGALNATVENAVFLDFDGVELGAEFKDLVYGRRPNGFLEITIEGLDYETRRRDFLKVGIIGNKENPISNMVYYWRINERFELEYSGSSNIYEDKISNKEVSCDFAGISLVNYFSKGDLMKTAFPMPKSIVMNTDYMGPIRIKPERDYRITNRPFSSGIEGENTYQILIFDALSTDKKLISEVSKWYEDNFEGWGIHVNQDKAPIYQIELKKDFNINIKDVGMGMNQALPLVVRACAPASNETLIIIEEPESHLHPAAHGNLAELFVDSLKQGNKRYLIETHSQNFVLRLRRLIAEKKFTHFTKDDILIYYVNFDEEKNESILERIEIDELGRVSSWPENVFSETLDETLAIRTAQLDSKKNVD